MTVENVAHSPVYIETSGDLVTAGIYLLDCFIMKTNYEHGCNAHSKSRAHRLHFSIYYLQLWESVAQKQEHDSNVKFVNDNLLL